MAGFLRKKVTLGKKRDNTPEQPPVAASPDVPPSLPPLFAQPDPPLVDPESILNLYALNTSPAPQRPPSEDDWLTWLGYSDTPDHHNATTHPLSPLASRDKPPSDNQVHSFSPSTTRTNTTSQGPQQAIPPPNTSAKKHTAQNKPTKPPSSTSLSSNATPKSSYHSTTTPSYQTPSTSTSSFTPIQKVIDVNNTSHLKPPSDRSSNPQHAASPNIVGRPRSSYNHTDGAPPRRVTTTTTTRTQRPTTTTTTRPSSPPTSYAERGRSTPSRQASANTKQPPHRPSDTQAQVQPPMRFDALRIRTVSAELCGPQGRKGPLIFSAKQDAAARDKESDRQGPLIFAAMSPTGTHPETMSDLNTKNATTRHSVYPSPPPESKPPKRQSASSLSHSRGTPHTHVDTRSDSPPVVPFEPHPPRLHRVLTKSRSTTPLTPLPSHTTQHAGSTSPPTPLTPSNRTPSNRVVLGDRDGDGDRDRDRDRDRDPARRGINGPLLLDADPFAKVDGVRVLQSQGPSSKVVVVRNRSGSRDEENVITSTGPGGSGSGSGSGVGSSSRRRSVIEGNAAGVGVCGDANEDPEGALVPSSTTDDIKIPPTPVSPEDYKAARAQRRGQWLEKVPPPLVAEVIAKQREEQQLQEGEEGEGEEALDADEVKAPPPPPTYFPIIAFLSNAHLLPHLLSYLSFSDWLALYGTSKTVRGVFTTRALRECVLERFLRTVGYKRWEFEWAEKVVLSLKDLNHYMHGVSLPTHEYARQAAAYLQPKPVNRSDPGADGAGSPDILALALTTRAYTRVVLRLRTQAESEERDIAQLRAAGASGSGSRSKSGSSSNSSRAPSPSSSSRHSHSRSRSHTHTTRPTFRSPLYRPSRAPLLRVFVPSPDGTWLSDSSVLECEAELSRSGILKLLKPGDVIWDVAVGDEANTGRLIWDGRYLIDLDYTYSNVGELPMGFESLRFAPSYFHRVIRTGVDVNVNLNGNGNGEEDPIVYVDVSPWGEEIARRLQLLQDRMMTETPHGALHSVVRWVHRSSFTIRPPPPPALPDTTSSLKSKFKSKSQVQASPPRVPSHPNTSPTPTPIPTIDPGWYGTVVIETEGTNEGLADLQARCGPGAFPPRAESVSRRYANASGSAYGGCVMTGERERGSERGKERERERDGKSVWRVMRGRSRPGEIWLRAVREKERLM